MTCYALTGYADLFTWQLWHFFFMCRVQVSLNETAAVQVSTLPRSDHLPGACERAAVLKQAA